jgi:hypothetical protein
VFWWFERRGEFLRCETRERTGGGYELLVIAPDGIEQVERFDASSDLAHRQADLERELADDGWTGPHGWNL